MNDFENLFDKLARTDDASILWTNWLDWVIDQNLIINHDRQLDFKGNEETYFKLYKEWIKIVSDELEKGDKYYYDYLGVFYENVIQSKYKAGVRGQFFTPADVCQVMTELTIKDNVDYTGKFVNDCCCGSGRFLLAAHSLMPGAIMTGSDLDDVACKMSVLNFYIHGVRGSIIHQNTLTGETFQCWKINDYLGYGLPIPHIQLTDIVGAYNFIGVNDIKKSKTVEINPIQKETVQTKLM